MRFEPLLIVNLILEPLRYYFANYGDQLGFKYDEDEQVRTVDIGHILDFHKIALEQKPRILVNRGTYQIAKTGLTDNMANSKTFAETKGSSNRNNMVFVDGTATIIVESRNLGSCERLADMVSHFVVWTRPLICDTQGFKEFGLNMQVGEPAPGMENGVPKFTVNISVPYFVEEKWNVSFDNTTLKSIIMNIGRSV